MSKIILTGRETAIDHSNKRKHASDLQGICQFTAHDYNTYIHYLCIVFRKSK